MASADTNIGANATVPIAIAGMKLDTIRQLLGEVMDASNPVDLPAAATPSKLNLNSNTLYIIDPNERCPRWPDSASNVITIPEAFSECVKNNGSKNALMFKTSKEAAEWTPVTWTQYQNNVFAVAKAMMANGVEATDSVNILAFNSPEWFYAVMGVIHIGGIGAGIYGSNNPEGVRYVAAHSKAKIIFVDSKAQLDKVQSVRSELPNLKLVVMWKDNLTADEVPKGIQGVMSWDDFLATGGVVTDAQLADQTEECDAAKPCFLSYTSGTTGNPKAVMHSHDTIIHGSKSLFMRLQDNLPAGQEMTPDERSLSYLPLSHVAGSIPMFAQLLMDNFKEVVYFAFPDALKGSLGATLKEVKPTVFIAVPRVWEKFHAALGPAVGPGGPLNGKPSAYARGALGLGECKMGIVGAAPVAKETMDFFDSIDTPIYEVYGMTENFALSHVNVTGERKIGSVGRCTPGGETKLAETTEICTRSRATMLGYMYNKEKTEDAIDSEGWLHTGDLGKVDDDGYYFIIGRSKEILVTAGGENVAPVLLESALKKHLSKISNVMMIGDKRKFVAATFTLTCQPDGLGGFTDELDAPSSTVDPNSKTIADAQASAVWKAYIDAGVAAANKEAISGAQQTKKWAILSADFSVPGGELTPTLKLKRPVVYEKYAAEIDAIYTGSAAASPAAKNPLFSLDPNERCPRWPAGATDVQTIPEAFSECVKNNGSKNALMFKTSKEAAEWTPVTWTQYQNNVFAVAKAMMANGVEATDSVNILAFNSPEWFYAVMGVIHIGGIGAGIYGSNNPEGVRYVAAHSKAKIIFVDSKAQLDKVQSVRSELPNLKLVVMWKDNLTADEVPKGIQGVMSWDDFLATGGVVTDAQLADQTEECDAAKPCFLSYTSGTTGNPKAVMHSHDTIIHGSKSLFMRLQDNLPAGQEMTPDERSLSYLPLSHVAGSIPMFAQLLMDNFKEVVYFAFPDALKGSLGATLKEVKPTVFIAVPRVWEKFHAALGPAVGPGGPLNGKPSAYARGALGLGECKMGIVGAAPVAKETMDFFDSIDTPIYEVYGMTENFALSHVNVTGERKIGSVGRCTPGGETKLAETTEICTRSRATMLGYMYNKEKTEDAIDSEGWLHTGDLGKVDDDGYYFIIGRSKEILVTAGGENVAPVLLESALKKHLSKISNVMMIGDKRKFVAATFTLTCQPDGLGGFTDELDAPSSTVDPNSKTIADAQASAVWKAYIDAGVAAANKEAISGAQQTKKWAILSADFSVPGGELTPTLKLKRPVVYEKYAAEIDAIYAGDAPKASKKKGKKKK